MDAFLRQGCLLVPDMAAPAQWVLVSRKGERRQIEMPEGVVKDYAQASVKAFGKGKDWRVTFDKARAKEDVRKADKKGKAA
jgi:CRISPR-associated protein Csb1